MNDEPGSYLLKGNINKVVLVDSDYEFTTYDIEEWEGSTYGFLTRYPSSSSSKIEVYHMTDGTYSYIDNEDN